MLLSRRVVPRSYKKDKWDDRVVKKKWWYTGRLFGMNSLKEGAV
jgi:hypothetical protein